jgi:hypothetical protein
MFFHVEFGFALFQRNVTSNISLICVTDLLGSWTRKMKGEEKERHNISFVLAKINEIEKSCGIFSGMIVVELDV